MLWETGRYILSPHAVGNPFTQTATRGSRPWTPESRKPELRIQKHSLPGATKTDADVAEARVEPEAVGHAQVPGFKAPRTAAQDPVGTTLRASWVDNRALLIIVLRRPILHPLPYIALHVVQAPRIRVELPNWTGHTSRV